MVDSMDLTFGNEQTYVEEGGDTGPRAYKVVEVKGWEGYTEEQLETSLLQLYRRKAESRPVDPSELETKLMQLTGEDLYHARRSPTSSFTSGSIECIDEAAIKQEHESYDALLDEGGIPSHSLQQNPTAPQNAKRHKDHLDYWNLMAEKGQVFTAQLIEWQRFRKFQQKVRRGKDWQGHMSVVQNRRKRHGLESDIALNKDYDAQDRLNTWLEYQEYEHREQEQLQKTFDTHQGTLAARLEELGEDSIPEYHDTNIRDYCVPIGLVIGWKEEETGANFTVDLAEKKLAFARYRLNRASQHPKELINKTAWFSMDIMFLKAKVKSCPDIPDVPTRNERLYYIDEMEQTKKDLESTRRDHSESIEKRILVNRLEQEVELRLNELEKKKILQQHLQLRCYFVEAWSNKLQSEERLKSHRFLLNWIEQQRLFLISENKKPSYDIQDKTTDTGNNGERVLRKRAAPTRKSQHKLSPDGHSRKEQKETRVGLDIVSNQRVLRPRAALKRPLEPHVVVNPSPMKKQRLFKKATSKKTNKKSDVSKQEAPRLKRQPPRQVDNKNISPPKFIATEAQTPPSCFGCETYK